MISVLIPTLNEADHIAPLLDQLLRTSPSTLVEILVADGGSTDRTADLVRAAAAGDARVRLVANPKRRQAAGLNLAAELADLRATVLVRVDAHAAYPEDYLDRLRDVLLRTGAASVVVRLRTVGRSPFQRALALISNSKVGTGGAAHRVGGAGGWIDHGHHAAFRRSSFEAIGGYDESFVANEDAELDVRLRRSGGRIWLATDIEVAYYPRRTPAALARQYWRYGAGRARTFLKHRERLRLRQLLPPAVLLVLVASLAAAPWAAWTLLAPAAYLVGVWASAIALSLRHRTWAGLLTGVALPIQHMAWAAGFLVMLSRGRTPSRAEAAALSVRDAQRGAVVISLEPQPRDQGAVEQL